MRKIHLFLMLTTLTLITSCTKDKTPIKVISKSLCDSLNVTYSQVVKPIINMNCSTTGCHDSGSSVGDYSSYTGLKAAVDNGKFQFRAITIRDMPSVGPLSDDDIQKINCWLDQGAPNN